MNFWKKWFKKSESPPTPSPAQNPGIVFEIDGDQIITVCGWPRPTNNEEAIELVQRYSMLIYMLSTGKLIPHIQQAVANFQSDDKLHAEISNMILSGLQTIMQHRGDISIGDESKLPVVSPVEAFNVRGGND